LNEVEQSLCRQALADLGRPTPFLNNSCYAPRCGQPGQPCCHADVARIEQNICNPMTVCRGDRPLDTCLPCGAEQQPCCAGSTCPRGTVSQRLECNRAGSNETCVPCGAAGQPCCSSGAACAANSQCVNNNVGLPTCQPCGQPGQACCNGTTCVASVTCTGPATARVCQAPNCANGGACPPNSVCVGTTCQPCGTAGIQCCPGSTCTGANFLRCDASNVCQPCGAQNGTCCGSMPYCRSPSDVCTSNGDASTTCRPCGVLEGSPCCPGANGGPATCINQSLYCNGALNRCERCGEPNAQCCPSGPPCPGRPASSCDVTTNTCTI
jgi:hypothetical protein